MSDLSDRIENLKEKVVRADGTSVEGYPVEDLKEADKYRRKLSLMKSGRLPFLAFGVKPPSGRGV